MLTGLKLVIVELLLASSALTVLAAPLPTSVPPKARGPTSAGRASAQAQAQGSTASTHNDVSFSGKNTTSTSKLATNSGSRNTTFAHAISPNRTGPSEPGIQKYKQVVKLVERAELEKGRRDAAIKKSRSKAKTKGKRKAKGSNVASKSGTRAPERRARSVLPIDSDSVGEDKSSTKVQQERWISANLDERGWDDDIDDDPLAIDDVDDEDLETIAPPPPDEDPEIHHLRLSCTKFCKPVFPVSQRKHCFDTCFESSQLRISSQMTKPRSVIEEAMNILRRLDHDIKGPVDKMRANWDGLKDERDSFDEWDDEDWEEEMRGKRPSVGAVRKTMEGVIGQAVVILDRAGESFVNQGAMNVGTGEDITEVSGLTSSIIAKLLSALHPMLEFTRRDATADFERSYKRLDMSLRKFIWSIDIMLPGAPSSLGRFLIPFKNDIETLGNSFGTLLGYAPKFKAQHPQNWPN